MQGLHHHRQMQEQRRQRGGQLRLRLRLPPGPVPAFRSAATSSAGSAAAPPSRESLVTAGQRSHWKLARAPLRSPLLLPAPLPRDEAPARTHCCADPCSNVSLASQRLPRTQYQHLLSEARAGSREPAQQGQQLRRLEAGEGERPRRQRVPQVPSQDAPFLNAERPHRALLRTRHHLHRRLHRHPHPRHSQSSNRQRMYHQRLPWEALRR